MTRTLPIDELAAEGVTVYGLLTWIHSCFRPPKHRDALKDYLDIQQSSAVT
jgi:hypothetical protein